MKIGDKVRRKAPDGTWSEFVIKNQADLDYHKEMKAHGFTYVVIASEKEYGCESCSA